MHRGKCILHPLPNKMLILNRRQTNRTWLATPSRIRTSRTKWARPQREPLALKLSTTIRKIQMVCSTTAKGKVKLVTAKAKMKQTTSMRRSTLMEILQVMTPIVDPTATPMDQRLDLCLGSIPTCLQK
jgi:hypothetical protein